MEFSTLANKFGPLTGFLKKTKGAEHNVYREWALLLLVALMLLGGVAAWSYYLYSGISRGDLFVGTEVLSDHTADVDRIKLEATLSHFTEKQTRYENLKGAPPTVTDPML